MDQKPIVKTDKLSVIYFMGRPNQVNAVSDVNIEIYPGEFIIFFGPSGCGKSTLLYSIAGLERNIQGDIFIEGKNLAKFNDKELDNHRQSTIGMIFQSYYLISSLNVMNNIILPQFSMATKNEERKKKALDLLNFFNVSTQKDKYPDELSGGQQQRVAICRSLINEPKLILADEPTGNLDSKSATDVMNLLATLNEEKKKTVILVTHSPGSLDYAHRVFHMKDGRIINVTVNRKLGEPISKALRDSNILEKDLETNFDKKEKTKDKKLETALIASGEDNLLVSIKAKEIIAEVLTGLSSEELEHMQSIVEKMIASSVKAGSKDLLKYLDDDFLKKGLGLDSRTANNITTKIKNVVTEIKDLHDAEDKFKKKFYNDYNPEITSIRHHIFDQFDIKLVKFQALVNFDGLVARRLKGEIDQKEVRALLSLSVEEGGVGLDRRLVDKIVKRIELLILGKL